MFGDNLKKIREARGLSQAKLAELLSVSQQTVGSWEVNRTSPAPEIISEISSKLDVTTDYLLGRTDNPVLPNEKPPAIDDEGLKFALWGDDDVDDDILEDVKIYARIKREMDKQKKG